MIAYHPFVRISSLADKVPIYDRISSLADKVPIYDSLSSLR